MPKIRRKISYNKRGGFTSALSQLQNLILEGWRIPDKPKTWKDVCRPLTGGIWVVMDKPDEDIDDTEGSGVDDPAENPADVNNLGDAKVEDFPVNNPEDVNNLEDTKVEDFPVNNPEDVSLLDRLELLNKKAELTSFAEDLNIPLHQNLKQPAAIKKFLRAQVESQVQSGDVPE